MYLVQKNLTKLKNDQCTGFLDPKELEEVKRASVEELISLAQRCGLNVNNYIEREETDYNVIEL